MRILLTNDDGFDSRGLQCLKASLSREHEVWVIAPNDNRSGSSHAITLDGPTRIKRVGEREYACFGTPADCVLAGCLGLLPQAPDMVVAGINLGPNLGTDIVYSGTAAAARQGALMGTPSLAASLASFDPPFYLEYPVEFILRNLELIRSLWAGDHFLNLNFPNTPSPAPAPLVTFPTRRVYKDELVKFQAPKGELYCFLGGAEPESQMEEGSDHWGLMQGRISISPILIHPTNHGIEERYGQVRFWS